MPDVGDLLVDVDFFCAHSAWEGEQEVFVGTLIGGAARLRVEEATHFFIGEDAGTLTRSLRVFVVILFDYITVDGWLVHTLAAY